MEKVPLSRLRFTLGSFPSLVRGSDEEEGSSLLSSATAIAALLVGVVVGGVAILVSQRFFDENPTPEEEEELPESAADVVTIEDGSQPNKVADTPKPKKARESSFMSKLSHAANRFRSFVGLEPKVSPVQSEGPTMTTTPQSSPVTGLVPLTPLKAGYRGKFRFPSNVSGAEGLTTYGAYTSEEAQRIVELKTARANTSASSTMPVEVHDYIVQRAPAYGLDPIQVLKYVSIESGGNPNAISSTGAIGVFQFTGGTANDYGLKNRFDMYENIEAGLKLASNNRQRLKSKGIADSELGLYIAHQIGAGGASEVLSVGTSTPLSSLSRSTQSNISKNVGKNSRTVGEYLAANQSALNSSYQARVAAVYSNPGVVVAAATPSPVSPKAVTTPPPTATAQVTTPAAKVTTAQAPVTSPKQERLNPTPPPTKVAAATPKVSPPAVAAPAQKVAAAVPQDVVKVGKVTVTTNRG